MYILFLTFRYLTRKKIVLFPILVVWLCVMMLIIVTSIMGGFVDRVRDANRELYGDIIISSASSSQGFAGYDQLAAALKANPLFGSKIAATTPVVEAYALLYVPSAERSVPSLLVGVRPEERSTVSKFRESLFQQYQSPEQASEDLRHVKYPASKADLFAAATKLKDAARDGQIRAMDAYDNLLTLGMRRAQFPALARCAWLVLVIGVAVLLFWRAAKRRNAWSYLLAIIVSLAGVGLVAAAVFWPMIFPRQFDLAEDKLNQAMTAMDRSSRTLDLVAALPDKTYASDEEVLKAMLPAKPSFDLPAPAKVEADLPQDGCIVGSQIGFYKRDSRGNFVHHYPQSYRKVTITVFPPSKSGKISVNATNAVTHDFTIVDDSHTGVYDVDSLDVYAPFETVQLMAGMRPDPKLLASADPAIAKEAKFDPRCHQLLIRLKPEALPEMREIREQIDKAVQEFSIAYSAANPGSFPQSLDVQTWDEKQARYLGAVQNEKTMMTFIMLLMSGVVLVVIFLIFYQIVRDKTRDIGIIKAVGGSEFGVASIFLAYGLLIGIVGGGLGVLTGTLFVTHTNEIHEMIYQATGILIWDRSVYLFDRIPDVVHLADVVTYFGVALIAGILGAAIPAILAAFEDPVQAVRYE